MSSSYPFKDANDVTRLRASIEDFNTGNGTDPAHINRDCQVDEQGIPLIRVDSWSAFTYTSDFPLLNLSLGGAITYLEATFISTNPDDYVLIQIYNSAAEGYFEFAGIKPFQRYVFPVVPRFFGDVRFNFDGVDIVGIANKPVHVLVGNLN